MSNDTPSHFDLLGGEPGIRTLVDRFYDLMDAPEATHVRALHASSLKMSREKLRLFMTGWTGGPPVYVERYGHPRLRMRHLPFAISPRERTEWLWCMDQALDAHEMPDDTRTFLRQRLHALADQMVNQPAPTAADVLPVLQTRTIRIAPLAPDDHDRWHVLARGYKTFYETVLPDADYDTAWARLLERDHIYGVGASIDGELLGIAHYLYHTSTWTPTVCSLQDLFVDPAARGMGVARQLIEHVATEARAHQATLLPLRS